MLDRRSFVKLSAVGGATALGALYLSISGCGPSGASEDEKPADTGEEVKPVLKPTTKTVKDLAGREVVVPAEVTTIGALLGNSFMRVVFLGAISKTAFAMKMADSPWTSLIYPTFDDSKITYLEAAGARDPNVEELAAAGVDLVYYWNDLPEVVEKLDSLGIATLCVNPSSQQFPDAETWLKVTTDELNVYAETLGSAAKVKVDDWLSYAKETTDYISGKTKSLSQAERPGVYYIRQADTGLQCFAQGSAALAFVNLAGGRLVSENLETSGGFTDVTIEQVIEWNPDVIFMGWRPDTQAVTENPQFSSIKAVQDGKVYLNPASLLTTGWSYDVEAPLEMLYLAKTLHPELFNDLDLPSKVQEFYTRFRGASISLQDAQLMLEHKSPQ